MYILLITCTYTRLAAWSVYMHHIHSIHRIAVKLNYAPLFKICQHITDWLKVRSYNTLHIINFYSTIALSCSPFQEYFT